MDTTLIKLCVDTARGNVVNYSRQEADNVIRKAFVDLLGTDKVDYKTFRRHKTEIFEIIEEVAVQTITNGQTVQNAFYNQFVETRNLALGDTNVFYIENPTILTVSKFSGNHWDLKRQRVEAGSEITVQTYNYGVKVYTYFTQFVSGRISWSDLVAKIQESIDTFMASLVQTSFANSLTSIPAQFKATGSFTESATLDVCDHVQASNLNSELILVGTRTALSKLNGAVDIAYSENMKDEKNQFGYVKMWNGYKCMMLDQVHKVNTFDFAMPNDKIYVLPTDVKPIKLVNEGTAYVLENSDGTSNMDMSLEHSLQFKIGTAIAYNKVFGYVTVA